MRAILSDAYTDFPLADCRGNFWIFFCIFSFRRNHRDLKCFNGKREKILSGLKGDAELQVVV